MSPEFRDYLLELLAPLEGVTARRMFGGGGLSLEAVRRRCPSCGKGELALRLSRYGPFVGCAHYPACGYRRRLPATGDEGYGGLAKTLVCPLQPRAPHRRALSGWRWSASSGCSRQDSP